MTPPSTPTSILRAAPPTPTRVTFAPQSLCDALDPIWRERLRGQLPRRSSSESESSIYSSPSPASSRASLSSASCYSVASDETSPEATLEDADEDEDGGEGADGAHAHDGLVYPPRDSIEISVNRKRAAAMNRLQAHSHAPTREFERPFSPRTPHLRVVEVTVADDELDSHVPPALAARLSLHVKKKPSALNLLGHRVVSRVRDMVSVSSPGKSPRKDAFA